MNSLLINLLWPIELGLNAPNYFFGKLSSFVQLTDASSVYNFDYDKPSKFLTQCFLINTKENHINIHNICSLPHLLMPETVPKLFSSQIEFQILDFNSEVLMNSQYLLPNPEWILKEYYFFPSIDILGKNFVHPLLNKSLHKLASHFDYEWLHSRFYASSKNILRKMDKQKSIS